MARWNFRLPDIGEGVAEGEIVAWAEGIAQGARVAADQPLAEVMTDKATVTITCPRAGVIAELGGQVGQTIAVGANLVVLELDEAGEGDTVAKAQAVAPAPRGAPVEAAANGGGNAATAVGDIKESLPGMNLAPRPVRRAGPLATTGNELGSLYFSEKPLATPATRQLARELGVDLRTVPPTGPAKRVTKDDVKMLASRPQRAQALTQFAQPMANAEPNKIAAPSGAQAGREERTPLKGVRKKIFEQMARSKHTAAHFTFVEECDVTALKALRERLKPHAATRGTKLSFLPFIVKATVAALKRHPSLNSAFDEATQEIVTRRYINIGIATATESGLIVPVIRDADQKSILAIASEIQAHAEAARTNRVKVEDLQGSTFTITSLGQQGGLFATPILNFPEVGILGVHQIKQKPVVRDGQIVIGDVMLLSLSFDHRLIDGHVGAAFAYEIIHYLESPEALFLEMA